MPVEAGNISISTDNIFPIIKKWLYSEKDIFLRELVSNANDAIVKLQKLANVGEAELPEDETFRVAVTVDKEARTIAIADNGIGMTDDEVRRYINQIAFSGAKEFLERYKDKGEDAQIIGHFGLGFYSAFMVSEKVEIHTLSWQPGAEAVRWTSEGGLEYSMDAGDRATRGTTVTLTIAEDSAEYLDAWKVREVLTKYFRFLPYELTLVDAEADRKKAADGKEVEAPKPLNTTVPLWQKNARDCTEEEYKAFYHQVFQDYEEPLFWVHLNVDYPFTLKGILYFPKLKHEFDSAEGQVKLYCNQVFVADNIKEIIPEYLLLLKGCIDCPDLPLNVSRSFLQNDGTVRKLSGYITRKVADRLLSLFNEDRERYCQYWDSIHPFIKFGCLRDEKFYDQMKDAIVFKTIHGDYKTAQEYLDEFARVETEEHTEPHGDHEHTHTHEHKVVYYVSDPKQQAQYISLFRQKGLNAVELNTMIDNHFISFLEMKLEDTRFRRIDAELTDALKNGEGVALELSAREAAEKAVKGVNPAIQVQFEAMGEAGMPALVLLGEESRRMQEMSRMFGGMEGMSFPTQETLVLNTDHALVRRLADLAATDAEGEDAALLAGQLHDLAMLCHRPLEPEALTKFVERSTKLLEKLV